MSIFTVSFRRARRGEISSKILNEAKKATYKIGKRRGNKKPQK